MKFTVLSVALRGVAHLLKNESVSNWARKALLTGISPTPQESHSSEEEVMGLRAEDVNLAHLGVLQVSYSPKGIYTQALHVTHDNIGKLALELETELRYVQGRPYLVIEVRRGVGEDAHDTRMELHTGVWIVVLRNELHLFLDHQFECTFEVETFESEELLPEAEEPKTVYKAASGDLDFDINKPGSWLAKPNDPGEIYRQSGA